MIAVKALPRDQGDQLPVGLVEAQAQARVLPDFTDLVDQVGPSVVNIRTVEKARFLGDVGFSHCHIVGRSPRMA